MSIALVPYVTKNGLFVIGVTNAGGTAVANVTSLGANPTLYVNGSAATLYGPVWSDTNKYLPLATWQPTSPSTIAPTDVLTYTIPANGIVTALGGNLAVSSQAPVANYVGQLEPGFGQCSSFVPNRTMPIGVNLGGTAFVSFDTYTTAKNLRYRIQFAGTGVTYDTGDPSLPLTFTSGGSGGMSATIANYTNSNAIEVGGSVSGTVSVTGGQGAATFSTSQTFTSATVLSITGDSSHTAYTISNPGTGTSFNLSPVYGGTTNGSASATYLGQVGYPVQAGQYAFQFTDLNANNGNALVLWMSGNANVCATGSTGNVETTSGLVNGVRTVNGNVVTVTYANVLYKSTPNYPYGYNMNLVVHVQSPVGLWGSGGTITNFWIFAPGDEDMNTSNPLALPNYVQASLTSPNGNGPAIIRGLEAIAPAGYGNYQNYSDCPNINAFSFRGGLASGAIPLSYVRFYNTNPALDNVVGNGTYPWAASTKVYNNRLGFDGSDATGSYLDLSARPSLGGETDYGQYMNPFPGQVAGYCALEFVTTSPHGLRTGDQVVFPQTGNTSASAYACTGGSPSWSTPLTGTVAVTNGSTSITFTNSQTLTLNQPVVFGSDTSGTAYILKSAGTGTTFTIFPAYLGTGNAATTCNLTAAAFIFNVAQVCNVTGPSTFALACATFGATVGDPIQQLTGTAEIPLNFVCTPQTVHGFAPYGLYANHAAQWAGCRLLLPLMPYMSDACLQSIADEIAVNSLANAEILLELGDEHWNIPGFLTGLATSIYGRLAAFVAPGQSLNSYYTSPSTPVVLDNNQAYTLLLAHMHDVIQAQFDTHNKGLKVGRAFGGFWSGSQVATNMVTFANAHGIEMDYVMVGAYYGDPSGDVTWRQAHSTTGTDPGSWPCTLMLDYLRHNYKYSSGIWALNSSNYLACQGYTVSSTKPKLIAYEAQINDYGGTVAQDHDCWYTPTNADAFNAMIQSMQDGSPLVPGSGLQFAALYTFGAEWGNAASPFAAWSIIIYQGQAAGTGTGNLFTTPQGGSPGDGRCYDQANVSVELLQLQNWIQAANAPAPPPPPPPGPGTYQASPVTGGMLTFGLVLGGLIQFGPFSLFADYADPRQGTILYPDSDPAGVDPRQGFVVFTSSDPFGVDPRQGSILDPDTDPLGVDPRQGSVIN